MSQSYTSLFSVFVTYSMYMKEGEPKPVQQETSILNSLENQIALAKKLESVYENRPDMESFQGIYKGEKYEHEYSKESIEKDVAYVERVRKDIDEKNSSFGRDVLDTREGGFQLSEMLQAMVTDRMNKHWFKDCKAIMTSDYDDLSAGIDSVMKHEKGGYLGVSFDFTVSQQEQIVYNKLEREWNDHIEQGKISTLKYFEDPDTKQKSKLIVPKFIIGASKQDVEELAKAYLSDNTVVLENHPFKFVMLLQIEEQLQTALDHLETANDPKFDFAKKQYERIQSLLRKMKEDVRLSESMHENIDLYDYTKKNTALEMMKRFRIMRTPVKNQE